MIKKILILPLILILTFLMTKPYLKNGFPYTHDGENHLARFANYKIAIREGQFPPRFAPNLMNHYGYPVFNYNYPLANILSLPFSFLKINYEVTFKVIAISFIFLGLFGIFSWLKKRKLNFKAAAFGTVVYAATPFMWSTLLYRGNIGEIIAWGLFPWLLFLVEKSKDKGKIANNSLWQLHQLILPAFLLSHNISVMFGLPIVLIYAFFSLKRDKRAWKNLGQSFLISLGLSLWFWLPAIAEKNLVTVGQVSLINEFEQHFPRLAQLFWSPLEFGYSLPGSIDTLSFAMGGVQVLILILTVLMIIKTTLKKGIQVFFDDTQLQLIALTLGGSLALLFFQLPVTTFIWKAVPLAAFIQFPWRLSLFAGSLLAALGAFIWPQLSKNLKRILCLLLIFQIGSFAFHQPVDYFHRTNIDYDAFSQSTTTNNENLPITFNYQDIADWQPTATVLKGDARVGVKKWSGSSRHYHLQVIQPSIIVEPTMNYAGWETILNKNNQPFKVKYIDNKQIKGRIAYQMTEPGEYEVTTQFTQKTWPRIVGNSIALFMLLIISAHFFKRFFSKELNFYLQWTGWLFLLAWIAPIFISYQPSFPYATTLLKNFDLPQLLYSWANFDGVHYLTIISKGYMGTGLIQAFFPVFPLLVRSMSSFISNPVIAGLAFNTIIGYFLLKAWQKLVDIETKYQARQWSIYLLFLFPTAFFLNALYSEALFLLFIILSFLSAREDKWLKAGLFAAVASATRVVGIFLIPALLVELWLQKVPYFDQTASFFFKLKKFVQNNQTKILKIMLGILGLLGYMLYLQIKFHDPLYFYHVQSEFGSGREESLILYPQVVWRYLKILWTARPFDLKYYAYFQEFLVGTLGLLAIIWSWFKVRKSYVVFSALVFLLPTLTGTFSSMPRYILASFSIFLLLIKILADKPRLRIAWLAFSTLFLIINTILFIQGYWVA